jgi:hypothetical protein
MEPDFGMVLPYLEIPMLQAKLFEELGRCVRYGEGKIS